MHFSLSSTLLLLYLVNTCTSLGQQFNFICRGIASVHCQSFPHNENCGTDGVTYINACHFAQAKCANAFVRVDYAGPCVKPKVKTDLAGFDLILEVVCNDIINVDCSREKTALTCASNGVKYRNYCWFEKARCKDHSLHVNHGKC